MSNRAFAAGLLDGGYTDEEQIESAIKLIRSKIIQEIETGLHTDTNIGYYEAIVAESFDRHFPVLAEKFSLTTHVQKDFVTLKPDIAITYRKKLQFYIDEAFSIQEYARDYINTIRTETVFEPITAGTIQAGSISTDMIHTMREELPPTRIEFDNGSVIEAVVGGRGSTIARFGGGYSPAVQRARELLQEAREEARMREEYTEENIRDAIDIALRNIRES